MESNFDFGVDFLSSSTDDLLEGTSSTTAAATVVIDDEINNFLLDNKPKSTIYKDTSACKRLQNFMKELNPNEQRNFFELDKNELDQIMCRFFIQAKKVEKKQFNELYQPDTLNSFRNAWQRVLSDKGVKMNLKLDPDFATSRKVLASRRKQLTQLGMGNKPNATRPLEDVGVDKLYESGYFGTHTPLVLQQTMWWKITNLFGHRAQDEARK